MMMTHNDVDDEAIVSWWWDDDNIYNQGTVSMIYLLAEVQSTQHMIRQRTQHLAKDSCMNLSQASRKLY